MRSAAARSRSISAAASWDRLDELTSSGEFWEFLNHSPFTRSTPRLDEFAQRDRAGAGRGSAGDAAPPRHRDLRSIRVQPAEHARRFADRRGAGGAPRRVPGLRAHHDRARSAHRHPVPVRQRISVSQDPRTDRRTAPRTRGSRRSCRTSAGSGFDPTNNRLAEDRHIRVAIGRDYADVPPTKGVFKGMSAVSKRTGRGCSRGPGARDHGRSAAVRALDVARSRGRCRRRACSKPAAVATLSSRTLSNERGRGGARCFSPRKSNPRRSNQR